MKTKHILIVRYALLMNCAKANRPKDAVWLDHRQKIFDEYFMPSYREADKPDDFEFLVLNHHDILDDHFTKYDDFTEIRCPRVWLPTLQDLCNNNPCWMDNKNKFISYLLEKNPPHINFV